jgi:two-component system nitrogen regulation response regulator GlnG
MDGTVLVADDDRTIRTVLTQALTRAGCKVHATSSLVTLMRWVEEGKGDLVISDVVMPDGNGIEQIPRIAAERPGLPVIVISAQNTIMTAVKAAEASAYDYLPKPFDLPDLMKRAARALDVKRRAAPVAPKTEGEDRGGDLPLVGRTAGMQALYRLVAKVMNASLPLLITGESGTGKSLLARAVHDFSDRRGRPFVVVAATDFQGHDAAPTVLAKAKGGTLVLDEVGDLPEEAQARVVRMLDTLGDGAPRVMATTRSDLVARIEQGRFRDDLFYRLNAVTLAVPPLRERVDDIPLLGQHLRRYFDLHGGQLPPAGLYDRILRDVEVPLLEISLDATGGNQARCADLLGINRNTLRKKITDLDIRVTRRRRLM